MDRWIGVVRVWSNEMSTTMLDYHNDSISLSVIEALSDATGSDPTELEPLYHVIDPEALDRLFQDSSGDARVQFTYDGHAVEVRSDGCVVIDGSVHGSQ